ncbi:MAG TPA: ABC transporter substrate-binding protein, partial [Chloroflexota bacterium]|nr:ABC transporter substrate-binding protein [Chloroflexota bacterium]
MLVPLSSTSTSRRNFLRWSVAATAAALVAGCGSAPASPTAAPAASSASAPATAPTAAAQPAATTAPATQPTTASAKPTAATAPNTTPAAQSGVAASGTQEITVADAFFSSGNDAGDIAVIDPARRGTWGFGSLLWAPLIASDAATKPLPEKSLASKWETSEDGKTYTFHLRPEAKFSDGTPIIASDVVASIGYLAMMNNEKARGYRQNFASAAQRFFYDVEGFLDVATKIPYDQYGMPDVPGVKAPDDHTVTMTIMAPSSNFIERVMFAVGVFKRADMQAASKLQYAQLDFWPAHVAQSGQYKLGKVVPGDHYEMVPNENYFGPKPKLTKITVKSVGSDPNTLLTAFGSKQLDLVAQALTGSTVRQALADANLAKQLVDIPNWQVVQYWFTPNAPLDDEHVRRAFTMAVDRHALIQILNAGSAKPLFAPVNMHRNPAVPSCQQQTADVKPLPFDPAQAKKELSASKYGASATSMEIN